MMIDFDNIIREALILTTAISAPTMIACVVVGVAVAIIQAATQLQEQTVSFFCKLIATVVVILLSSKWSGRYLITFSMKIINAIPDISEMLEFT